MNTIKNSFTKMLLVGGLVFLGAMPLTAMADNPIPATVSISPTTIPQGSAGFNLTVNGSNFVAGSTVSINGVARPTTYISPTQLTVAVPAFDVNTLGTFNVSVTNVAPGGGTSNVQTLTIIQNTSTTSPVITNVSPASVLVGSGTFNLTVAGLNFVPGSVVRFNGLARTTTYVSANQLIAVIPTSAVIIAENQAVHVINPTINGGLSNAVLFTISPTSVIPGTTPGLPNTGFGPETQSSGLNTGLLAGAIGLLGALSVLIVTRKLAI